MNTVITTQNNNSMNGIKNDLKLQCWNCKLLDIKCRNIISKEWRIKCCSENDYHEIYDLKSTPKSCPFYAERLMMDLYE